MQPKRRACVRSMCGRHSHTVVMGRWGLQGRLMGCCKEVWGASMRCHHKKEELLQSEPIPSARPSIILKVCSKDRSVYQLCTAEIGRVTMCVLPCRKGHVCMIPRTKEFFISLKDHDEWGIAHTVWGEVSKSPFPCEAPPRSVV